jgi:DUF4097 and DUF4098 domain-containing protein YvlB
MSHEGKTASGREVRIATGSGSITVIAEPRAEVEAERGIVKIEDDVVKVAGHKGSSSLTVRVPEGSDVVIGSRSGTLKVKGHIGAVRAQTMSGRVDVERVSSADIRTMSGSIHVASCEALCRVKTKSGSAHVESSGSVDVAVGSGSIEIDHVEGAAHARCISGGIQLGAGGHGPIEAETMSGAIVITLPADCRPRVRAKSLSRSATVSLPAGDDCDIVAKTMSGAITVQGR